MDLAPVRHWGFTWPWSLIRERMVESAVLEAQPAAPSPPHPRNLYLAFRMLSDDPRCSILTSFDATEVKVAGKRDSGRRTCYSVGINTSHMTFCRGFRIMLVILLTQRLSQPRQFATCTTLKQHIDGIALHSNFSESSRVGNNTLTDISPCFCSLSGSTGGNRWRRSYAGVSRSDHRGAIRFDRFSPHHVTKPQPPSHPIATNQDIASLQALCCLVWTDAFHAETTTEGNRSTA